MTRNLGKQRENCGEDARAEAEAEEEGQRSTLGEKHYKSLSAFDPPSPYMN